MKPMTSEKEKAAPRKRLNIFEPLRAINRAPLRELQPLVIRLTSLLQDTLISPHRRVCRFDIDTELVEDTVRRFLGNSQYVVLKAPKSLKPYLQWAAQQEQHVEAILRIEAGLRSQRMDLGALWHSTGAAVFPTHCILNHSCEPNATTKTTHNETAKITVVAERMSPACILGLPGELIPCLCWFQVTSLQTRKSQFPTLATWMHQERSAANYSATIFPSNVSATPA